MYYDVLKESSYSKRDFQLSQEIFTEMEKRGDAQTSQRNLPEGQPDERLAKRFCAH